MTMKINGKQSIDIVTAGESRDKGVWRFCENGYQSIGINVTVEMFDMIKELVNMPEVVEFYEEKRRLQE